MVNVTWLSFEFPTTAGVLMCSTAALLWVYGKNRNKKSKDSSSSKFSTTKSSSIPSPPNRNWLLGHGLSLYDPEKAPEILVLEWMEKLNSKVVAFDLPIFLPINKMIVIADDEMVNHIVKNGYHKSPTYKDLSPVIGNQSMLIKEGPSWSKQRRQYNPGFSPDFLIRVVSVVVDKCHRMIQACQDDIIVNSNSSKGGGGVTNLNQRTIDMASDVIVQVAFGEDWGCGGSSNNNNNNSTTLDNLRYLIDEMGARHKNELRKFNPMIWWRVRQKQQALDRDMQALVKRRLQHVQQQQQQQQQEEGNTQQQQQQKDKDVLSLSLKFVMGKTPPKDFVLSQDDMDDIISQLKTFYFAGHDTTATAIAWAVWLLAQHPDKLEKVRNELKTELGPWATDMQKQAPPAFADWQRCTYLEAVIKEVLRLYPPVSTARYVSDPNATYQGRNIGNAVLWLSFYASHRHPDHWKDPDVFMPERFMDWNESDGHNKYHWMPFSRGPRDCIGKYFAMLEGKIAIAMLVMTFDVSEIVHTHEVMAARITNFPLHGCQVKFKPRES